MNGYRSSPTSNRRSPASAVRSSPIAASVVSWASERMGLASLAIG